jgi:hypothetical protein
MGIASVGGHIILKLRSPLAPARAFREVPMNSIQDVYFDDAATSAMGEAFDRACKSLGRFRTLITARELIAKRIIAAAKNGECDPAGLHEQALIPFGIEEMSMLVISVDRAPVPSAYASVAHAA